MWVTREVEMLAVTGEADEGDAIAAMATARAAIAAGWFAGPAAAWVAHCWRWQQSNG